MRIYYVLLILAISFSCKEKSTVEKKENKEKEIIVPELQSILDTANLEGAILVYDLQKDTYYANNFDLTEKGHLPASTYKIPNSIIALETGVVKNDSTVLKWDGKKRNMKRWEQDLSFKQAFHFSCVPCYQEIARNIGVDSMNAYIERLAFGTMKIDSTSIDMFWLRGNSKINQRQQIAFLKRFYTSQLPISKRTDTIMKRMMVIEETDVYKISGKTGWSINNEINNGWFVGFVELKSNTYFFATNVVPKQQFEMSLFPKIRKEVTYKALEKMNIIKF